MMGPRRAGSQRDPRILALHLVQPRSSPRGVDAPALGRETSSAHAFTPAVIKEQPMSLKDPNIVDPRRRRRVAIVIANPAVSTTTGWPVGFWWSELTHPYYVLSEAGYELEIFSPAGGKCEADAMSDPRDASGYSASDLISLGFASTPKLAALVANTRPVSEIEVAKFDAILVAGGQAPMFTFADAHDLHRTFVEFYEAGKLAVALCHGVAILRYAKLSNGEHLAKGKTVTGFANVEEDFADQAVWSANLLSRDKHVMPWRIEDELKRLGANFIQAGLWRGYAVRDGNLITGQQNFSGEETARLVLETLGR
jgi:putative intracellular protease/amidase